MKCPKCNVTLVMADKSGVEIDYCPDCRGVWLDRGELEKIVERASTQVSANKRFDDDYGDHRNKRHDDDDDDDRNRYKDPRHRKKSFWGELLDF